MTDDFEVLEESALARDQKAQMDQLHQLLVRYKQTVESATVVLDQYNDAMARTAKAEADLIKWHRQYLILSDDRDKLAAERDRLLDACRYARDTFAVYPWPYYSDVFSKLQAALAWDKNDLGNQ